MFVWDEKKRLSNIEKHKLDFRDAASVYNHPNKSTRTYLRQGEKRHADIAIVEVDRICLTLIHTRRGEDIRVISFRKSSRNERREHFKSIESN